METMTNDLLSDRLASALSEFAQAVWCDLRLPAGLRIALEGMYHKEVQPALQLYRSHQAATRPTFEVTLPGFDGATDETDDRVLWVSAPSSDAVRETVKGLGAQVELGLVVPPSDIDYVLPLQARELRARIAAAPVHPVYDVVDVRASHVERHRAIVACMVERHGWRFYGRLMDTVQKEFAGITASGEAGIITVSTQGTNMIKASWGWEDRGLLFVPLNVAPATVARDADAAAERFVKELRSKKDAGSRATPCSEDEPEGMSP